MFNSEHAHIHVMSRGGGGGGLFLLKLPLFIRHDCVIVIGLVCLSNFGGRWLVRCIRGKSQQTLYSSIGLGQYIVGIGCTITFKRTSHKSVKLLFVVTFLWIEFLWSKKKSISNDARLILKFLVIVFYTEFRSSFESALPKPSKSPISIWSSDSASLCPSLPYFCRSGLLSDRRTSSWPKRLTISKLTSARRIGGITSSPQVSFIFIIIIIILNFQSINIVSIFLGQYKPRLIN